MNADEQHDVRQWVLQAESGQHALRQAIHTILLAIAREPTLRDRMIMKGGILLAVRYQSVRFTRDIDFSTMMRLSDVRPEEVGKSLDASLALAVESLDYDLDCRLQSCKVKPPNRPEASFPTIELKIGYAYKGAPEHRRLLQGQSPHMVSIDFSLNEPICGFEKVGVGSGHHLHTYLFPELVAEKFRALLQQVPRDRYRRQDVYDLWLLSKCHRTAEDEEAILQRLIMKSRSRGIEPTRESLDDKEVVRRASSEYATLKDEVASELPDFQTAYGEVLAFFRGLPWR